MTSKGIQIGKDLDTARCNGTWTAIPELVRRYKKYNTDGIVVEPTVLADMNLIQLSSNSRSNQEYITIEPSQLVSIQNQLLTAIQTSDPNSQYVTQKEFAKVVLARTHFECGEYEKTIDIISQLSFGKDLVNRGYGLILFLQARAMKAISFELVGNESAAIQSYESLSALLNENLTVRYKFFTEWSEEALYRAILLGLKEGSTVSQSSLFDFMRNYQRVTRTQPTKWRMSKRLSITKSTIQYFSQSYRQGQYALPPGINSEQDVEKQYFIAEQSQWYASYEKLLYADSPLSKAGQVNRDILDFIDQLAGDFELTSAADLRGFVEVLDRASQKTFNSPLITRHLFHALVKLGELEEAEHALHAYLYLVGLVSHGWRETRRDGKALVTDHTGLSVAVPEILDDNEDEDEIGDLKNAEKEDSFDILKVIVTAIKMYCNDLCRAVDAVEMAEIGKILIQKNPQSPIASELYRSIGVAYGFLGRQTFDPDVRPNYLNMALEYLQTALKHDSNSWENYYQIALHEAEMHDITSALQHVLKALELNNNHIAVWHLLVLLTSCPVQGGASHALNISELGLKHAVGFDEESPEAYEQIVQHMMYQKTRTLLLHTIQGTDPALKYSKSLFTILNKIPAVPEPTISNGFITSGSFGNLSELQARKRAKSTNTPPQISATNIPSPSSANEIRTLGKARSTSNLSNATPPSFLAVPDDQQQQQHQHHSHGIHLFSSKSSSSRSKLENSTGDVSATGSLQSLTVAPYDKMNNTSAVSIQSTASSIMSIQPSILQPNNVITKPNIRMKLRKQRMDQMLSDLWLLTAKIFMKAGRLDEARKAIEEAEHIDWSNNAKIWCCLGQLYVLENQTKEAQVAFEKALVIDPFDVESRLELAKSRLDKHQELAEGILDELTKTNGWDCPEAWFELGDIYKRTDRLERTKDCLFYALELESTTCIQSPFILPRYI